MLARRLLSTFGQSGGFTIPPYVGLINAAPTAAYAYVIGPISSHDGGATWTAGSGAVIGPSTDAWKTVYVKDPSLVWDGSQYVCYYCGWNTSNFQVGRATAAAYDGTWTDYGSNPILGVPNDGSWRASGALFPFVFYDATESPAWKMWVTGSNAGVMTVGFLDSSDGLTWTDHGQVVGLGAAGTWRDEAVFSGGAIKVGSTWYVLISGRHLSNHYTRSGYTTCTDPANPATYATPTQYPNLASDLTVGGKTWHSNQPRFILQRGATYCVGLDTWFPTSGTEEACTVVTTSDLTSLPVPGSTLMIPINDGSWHANSAENPTAIVAP